MSKEYHKVCLCFGRMFWSRAAEPPEDVKMTFARFSENGTMSVDQLRTFLTEFQGDNATKEDAQVIFNSLKHLNIIPRKGLHLGAFLRYLLGDYNLPLPVPHVHHDMDAPLPHYFLYTGHNSYLTGNQLSSDCSVVPIIKALHQGVRVIELDLWPNATKDNVDVYHGGTLTTPVGLLECLRAIKDHAFSVSEYPVVITFEDHLTSDLQSKTAKMAHETFGDMLLCSQPPSKELLTPQSLKRRVMISTKPPKDGSDDNENDDEHNAVPEYRSLIAIPAAKLKGGIENFVNINTNKVQRLSLSEQELQNAARIHGTDLVRFTQQNLLRVYPKGTRVDSSNYDPFFGWMHGAQMVAFNLQDYGKHQWIMQGLFKANGGCGYVKKPDFLLNVGSNGEVFDPFEKQQLKRTLKVKVYMGEGWRSDFRHTHFDWCSPPDFYTRVGIAGVPADSIMMKTRIIEDDWLPMWNQEFAFPLTVPELAVLRIEVREYDVSKADEFGGQTCLPVSELRTGIRSVPLNDRKGVEYKYVRLLVQFTFIDHDTSC